MELVVKFDTYATADVRKCEPFSAYTDCPSCGGWDHFPFAPVDDGFVSRECPCGFVWRQFA